MLLLLLFKLVNNEAILGTLKRELQIHLNILFRKLRNCEQNKREEGSICVCACVLKTKWMRQCVFVCVYERDSERGASVSNRVMKANFLFTFLFLACHFKRSRQTCFQRKIKTLLIECRFVVTFAIYNKVIYNFFGPTGIWCECWCLSNLTTDAQPLLKPLLTCLESILML